VDKTKKKIKKRAEDRTSLPGKNLPGKLTLGHGGRSGSYSGGKKEKKTREEKKCGRENKDLSDVLPSGLHYAMKKKRGG